MEGSGRAQPVDGLETQQFSFWLIGRARHSVRAVRPQVLHARRARSAAPYLSAQAQNEDCWWKPGGLGQLEEALGLLREDAGRGGFGQVAPAVDLLHGLDKDPLADGQQVELGKVEVGDVAHVTRQVAGLAEDRVGLAGASQGVPGQELLVGEGAPEEPGALEGRPAVQLQRGAGIARDGLPAADEPKTARIRDCFSDAPSLRYITNLHARLGKQFLRQNSMPLLHAAGGCQEVAHPWAS
jgi:hypothetical protein